LPGYFDIIKSKTIFRGREVVMADARCSKCHRLFDEEELLVSETTGELICEDCSGLLAGEDLGCRYVEEG